MKIHLAWSLAFATAAAAVVAPMTPAAAQELGGLSELASSLEWREIGPAVMGGRVTDLAVNEANPAHYFVGTATGGLWKTTSGGQAWEPVFDDQPNASIGAVSIAPSNPNVVWVGTGEAQNRQSSPYGAGMFKSTDGGRTWEDKGLMETRHIGGIVIHPTDPDVVYVAAMGKLWGANPERGVFRTTDGGDTWEKVLYIDDHTGAIDLVMDPGDPRTLFAAMYQRQRTGWGYSADGEGSGLYRTVDGGASWTELTEGLPDGYKGRIGLDVHRRDGNLVYALIESKAGQGRGVYRSLDRGDSWERMSDTNPRPMYFSMIRVDPNDPERIYIGGVSFGISEDGGRTFREGDQAEGIHVDHHALWVNPENSNHVLLGNDGGLAVSLDRGQHWRQIDNLALGQFYEIGVSMEDPYTVCGGLQDNSSWCAPHNTLTQYGIMNGDWEDVSGGDGFYNKIDPTDPNIVYTESQGGNISRYDRRTGESARIRPVARPTGEESDDDEEREYRFNWNAPIHVSIHDPAVVYIGANHLLRSPDRGATWEEASPDLTLAIDRDTLQIMGMSVTDETLSRNDGISTYGNITTVTESSFSPDLLYVGTDDGNVQITRDGGATWTNLTPNLSGLPPRTYVSSLVASEASEGRVYATFDGHRNDDLNAYVYVSEDFGESWGSIVAGLPNESVNRIREHPRTHELLFVGNEVGVWFSVNSGTEWQRLDGNLPTVPVDDIVIHPRDNDLILGTHGRSAWIMDDITPLETLANARAQVAHVFGVREATLWNVRGGWPFWGDEFQGSNPPYGAQIRYLVNPQAGAVLAAGSDSDLEAEEDAEAQITIRSADGTVVRTLDGSAEAGLHTAVWDLRMDAPYEAEGDDTGGRFGGAPSGPKVLPGTYTAHLTYGDHTASAEVRVRYDPRAQVNQADLAARQAALLELHTLAEPVWQAGRRIRDLEAQVKDAKALLDERDDAPAALVTEADSLAAHLEALREDLNPVTRALFVGRAIEGVSTRPTADQLWQMEKAWTDATVVIEALNRVIETRMPAFNAMLNEAGVRPEAGEAVAIPSRPGG